MTTEKLEQELKQEKLNSIYLLYGEEEYLLDTTVKKIKKLFLFLYICDTIYKSKNAILFFETAV